jgi:uncharacterized protein YggE
MTSQDRVWKVGVIVGVLLAVFLAILSIKELKSIAYVGQPDNAVNSIYVNGKGTEVVIPDIATFSFTVIEKGKTVAEAQEKATTKINATLTAVREGGVKDEDIKTISYQINPDYEYSTCTQFSCPPQKATLVGYTVSQAIEVKIRDLEKAGDLFTTIGTNGVQNINGLNFTIDDIETVKAEAREKAIADARAKADVIAKQLGVRLVRVVAFNESSEMPYYYARGAGDMAATAQSAPGKAPAPEIPGGEQEIVANVTVTYEIK